MDPDRFKKFVDQWGNLAASLGALIAAVSAIWTPLTTWSSWAGSWHELLFSLIAAALVTVIVVRTRNAHLSLLVDPDALRLDPQVPEQLVGRQEDLTKLLRVLANRLVFLVGESGCGKTALLEAGVTRNAAFTARFLPIYIDMSVLDWDDGPLLAVREGFLRALSLDAILSSDEKKKISLDAESGQMIYVDMFANYYRTTQRRPLILLDQFDDFQAQARYRDRFLPGETNV